ncbi:MAG: hypothetical protein WC623_19695 [Pedobacter sp.]
MPLSPFGDIMPITGSIISIIGNILKKPINKLPVTSRWGLSVVPFIYDKRAKIIADVVMISFDRNLILTRNMINKASPIPIVIALLAKDTYSEYVARAPDISELLLVYTPEIDIIGNKMMIISKSMIGFGTQVANGPLLYIML